MLNPVMQRTVPQRTVVRALSLALLASSALTVALASPAPAQVGDPASTSQTARAAQPPSSAKAAARKRAVRKAHARAVAAARRAGTHRVDRTLSDVRIHDSSGLARSTYDRSTLFTHNDRGEKARVHAVDGAGRTRAVIRLRGASRVDWEDIASGPRHRLWVADTGDTRRTRRTVVVHRFTEPRSLPDDGRTVTVRPTSFRFALPDGARNVEALLVHPRTGRLHLVSRDTEGGTVYAAPRRLRKKSVNRLTAVAPAPARVTAGSWSPDGRTIVLGTPTKAYTYGAFGEAPRVTTLPKRRKGESLEVARNGRTLLVGSEGRYSSVLALRLPRRPGGPVGPVPDPGPVPPQAPGPAPDPSVGPTPTAGPAPTAQPGCAKAPAYRSSTTLFGASLSASDGNLQQALATNDALFGRLPVVRQFDPTVPPKGAWSRRTFFDDRTMVVSFREPPKEILSGQHDVAILDHFRSAPTRKPIFWSYFHEPEPHIANGTFTYAQYRAAWRHVVDLVGTLCRTNLYPTLVLTGWTTEPASGRSWRDYYPGDDHISVVSWDPYNSATGTPTSYPAPAKLFASVVRASRESGKPWGIAETGSALVPGDDGTRRAKWLTEVGRYFDEQGAAFVTYFQSTRDGDFKLRDSASVRAWSTWVEKYD